METGSVTALYYRLLFFFSFLSFLVVVLVDPAAALGAACSCGCAAGAFCRRRGCLGISSAIFSISTLPVVTMALFAVRTNSTSEGTNIEHVRDSAYAWGCPSRQACHCCPLAALVSCHEPASLCCKTYPAQRLQLLRTCALHHTCCITNVIPRLVQKASTLSHRSPAFPQFVGYHKLQSACSE